MIGVFHIGVLFMFGLPIFGLIIGVGLVWVSKTPRRAKAIVSISPILLVPISLFLSIYLKMAESEKFVLPSEYRGEIVIFYDEPCGNEPDYDNGSRVYNIPSDGILITQFRKNAGYLNRRFFQNQDGKFIEIPLFLRQNFQTEKNDWEMFQSSPVKEFSKDTVGAFWAYGTETYGVSRNSLGYIISDYKRFDKSGNERWKESNEFAERAKNKLLECRGEEHIPEENRFTVFQK